MASLARYPASTRLAVRRELKLRPGAKLAMFHGTLEAHHGQESLPRLMRQNPGFHFLILGGGPGYGALKRAVEGQSNVSLLPFQAPAAVARYAAAADLGMVPYEPSEGLDLVFTLKLLEYFALGMPVVSFKLKSVQASFGRFPQLLVSEDEADFGANLKKALRVKRSAALRQLIRREFSWAAVTSRMASELESL